MVAKEVSGSWGLIEEVSSGPGVDLVDFLPAFVAGFLILASIPSNPWAAW
jgi:hypothetical protein